MGLTDHGQTIEQDEILPLRAEAIRRWRDERRSDTSPMADSKSDDLESGDEPETGGEPDEQVAPWRDQLLDILMKMDPGAFEHLAVRLLREAGFISTSVTGRSHDGGIDGVGTYRMSLLSSPSTSNASAIRVRWVLWRCVTFGVPWPVEVTRDC